jgi:peptidoglycan/LPS O-acetylase OafA/YrhL
LNETLLWLLYCVSGLVAFAAIHYGRWRMTFAVLAGGLVTGAGWALLYHLTDEEKRPHWLRLDLSLNLSFGLIFAVLGAALAWRLRSRQDPGE